MCMNADFKIRTACLHEIDELNSLIKNSATQLSESYYSQTEIAALNQHVFGVDKELIDDKTYFVIETKSTIAACGGWSKRKTLFGGDQSPSRIVGWLDPKKESAKIRAFFIHPDYARQGLATALLKHCEKEAHQFGFTSIELMATLPGVPFYKAQHFIEIEPYYLQIPNNIEIKLVKMEKKL